MIMMKSDTQMAEGDVYNKEIVITSELIGEDTVKLKGNMNVKVKADTSAFQLVSLQQNGLTPNKREGIFEMQTLLQSYRNQHLSCLSCSQTPNSPISAHFSLNMRSLGPDWCVCVCVCVSVSVCLR